jgi:arsenate reductase (thioredoxin)
MQNTQKLKILFLCTGNSCRSQMAEGFARHLKKDEIEAYSAGVAPKGIDPLAVKAMVEVNIDISIQKSTSIEDIKDKEIDFVITLCDNAQKTCPSFPAKTGVLHVGFDDPPRLAKESQSEAEAMDHYRRVRDQIKAFVETMPDVLFDKQSNSIIDQKQVFAGIQSFWSQLPEDLTGKTPSTKSQA